MKKLVMLKGLPASGKSTYAKELVAQGYKRVNKDLMREMVDNGKWSRVNEEFIFESEFILAGYLLEAEHNVVVDDCSFAWENQWKDMAHRHNAEFEIKFFDTPVMECIERDSKRGEKSVGAKAIMGMYDRYLKPKLVARDDSRKNCYIFDIDGTLAKMNGRSPYDYKKVGGDIPNRDIVALYYVLAKTNVDLIIVSGRKDECRDLTVDWLHRMGIGYNKLLMRKSGDDRNDAIVKREIYEEHIKDKYDVLAVFDDRNRVVDMWRSLGLTCLQVDYGNF